MRFAANVAARVRAGLTLVMRSLVLVPLFLTLDAVAQIGVGIYLPAGRRAQRLGTVPDSLALYSPTELDLEPRHAQGVERWTERIARMEECPIDTALYQCEAEGVVVLRFTVERDGAITDAQVVKGGCPGLNRRIECAAMRSAPWEPGRIGYHKVRTRLQVKVRL